MTLLKNLLTLLVIGAGGYIFWDGYVAARLAPEGRLHERVLVYSRADCLPCTRMVRELSAERVPVTERFVDDDEHVQNEVRRKLDEIGFRQRVYQLPVVDVYGKVFPDNPSIPKVKAHLKEMLER